MLAPNSIPALPGQHIWRGKQLTMKAGAAQIRWFRNMTPVRFRPEPGTGVHAFPEHCLPRKIVELRDNFYRFPLSPRKIVSHDVASNDKELPV